MPIDLPPEYQPSADEEFMNPRQVEYFRRRLENAREDLRRGLDAIPSADANDLGRDGDQTDHASASSEREFEVQNRERVQMLLRQTERALARLENRTYGYCEDTGEPIDLKPLMVHPTTNRSRPNKHPKIELPDAHGRARRVCLPRPSLLRCPARADRCGTTVNNYNLAGDVMGLVGQRAYVFGDGVQGYFDRRSTKGRTAAFDLCR